MGLIWWLLPIISDRAILDERPCVTAISEDEYNIAYVFKNKISTMLFAVIKCLPMQLWGREAGPSGLWIMPVLSHRCFFKKVYYEWRAGSMPSALFLAVSFVPQQIVHVPGNMCLKMKTCEVAGEAPSTQSLQTASTRSDPIDLSRRCYQKWRIWHNLLYDKTLSLKISVKVNYRKTKQNKLLTFSAREERCSLMWECLGRK